MQSAAKVLQFPLAGLARDMDYRKAYIPSEGAAFATPMAVNVIGECPFSGRLRGGSRPGMTRVVGVSPSGEGGWAWPNGMEIGWTEALDMSYDTFGTAIDSPFGKILDQHGQFNVSAAKGNVPDGCSVMAYYRMRLVVAKGSAWYASRQGDVTDFDYGGDSEDVGRAVVGNVGRAGCEGEEITAIAAPTDAFMVIATKRSMKLLSGEPTAGALSAISDFTGIVSRNAWCWDGSVFWFVGLRGVYAMAPGEGAAKLVSNRLPEDLEGFTEATMVYDPSRRGIHIFGTQDGERRDWYFDVENGAFWPLSYSASVRPTMGGTAVIGGKHIAVFRCSDGEWRYWDDKANDDDGVPFTSFVAIGPLRASARDDMDGMLAEVSATIGKDSCGTFFKVYAAHSPEQAVADAIAGEFKQGFGVSAGWNHVTRPRVRGAWVILSITATGRWSYESVTTVCKMFGRLR